MDIGPFYRQILEILTTPPGNLVYHLVLSFSIAGASLSAFSQVRAAGSSPARRAVIGLFLLLLAQMALMLNAGLAQFFDNAAALLPVLDRSVAAFSLVLIVWLWVFPDPFRLADAATILLALLVLTLTSLTRVWWANQLTLDRFNGSPMDQLWVAFSLSLSVFGGLLLLIRRPPGFGAGLGMFGLFFIGQLLHLFAPLPSGDYPGAVRLAQLAAYPFLLALPQRFPVPALKSSLPPSPVAERPRRARLDPAALQSFLALSTSSSWPEVCQAATVAAAYSLQAEYSLLVLPPDSDGKLRVECGYNLAHSERIPGFSLESQSFPLFSAALGVGRALRLHGSSTAPDLAALALVFHLPHPVPVLFVPIPGSGELTVLGIVLLSPLDAPSWTTRDQDELAAFSRFLAGVLQRFQQMREMEDQLTQARQEMEGEESKKKEIERRNEALLIQLQDLKAEAAQERSRAESLVALVSVQEGAQETISRLQAENERLARLARPRPSQMPPTEREVESLRGELRLVLEEVARLRSEVFQPALKAQNRVTPAASVSLSEEKAETIASITRELRQPLASILGYTDLLLSESVGILGALQRKFLERVKASAERLGGLIDALIRAVLEASHVDRPVDLQAVIRQAMADSAALMNEKHIRVQLDLPDRLPPVFADWDALQQALFHLLQNAGSATPPGGKVTVHARLEGGEVNKDYILVQVTDQGSGIPAEEQGRVFSRLYRPGNNQIQGVDDTGIELSIVKTLVEAQGGRVWLDAQAGQGTTFSLLLPASSSGHGI